jgi:hypothetical protein
MSSQEIEKRVCMECRHTLFGREDKKFCSDQCRNSFNNRQNKDFNSYARKVNSILRKNRRILSDLNPDGKRKLPKDELVRQGFDFKYYTSSFITKNDKEYRYCYDQGYLEISPDWYILVHKKEYSD